MFTVGRFPSNWDVFCNFSLVYFQNILIILHFAVDFFHFAQIRQNTEYKKYLSNSNYLSIFSDLFCLPKKQFNPPQLCSVSHNFLKTQVKGPMIKANIQLANLRFMTAIESYGRGVFRAVEVVPKQDFQQRWASFRVELNPTQQRL